MKRRILSVLITSVMLAALFAGIPLNASAVYASGETGECIWTVSGSTLTISPGASGGRMADYDFSPEDYIPHLVYPDSKGGGSAEIIDDIVPPYFQYRDSIKSIVVEPGVTHIGSMAFTRLDYADTVSLPDGLKVISWYAFCECYSLRTVDIPDSVVSLGEGAFYACYSLESVSLSENLTRIDTWAFEECTVLTSIVIPDKVEIIGREAFGFCSSLRNVRFSSTLLEIGEKAFYDCKRLTEITVPSTVDEIGEMARGYIYFKRVNPDARIIGKIGSEAETYANKNGIYFEKLVFYNVTFEPGNGSGEMPRASVPSTSKNLTLPECGFEPPSGYEFHYWRIGNHGYFPGETVTISANTVITAIWKTSDSAYRKVVFSSNGGSGRMGNEYVVSGGTFTFPECMFKAPEGKEFRCWMIGRVYYHPGDTLVVTEDITTTAIWQDVVIHSVNTARVGGTPVAIVGQSAADNPPDCFSRLYNSRIVSACWTTKVVLSGRTRYVEFTGNFEEDVEYYPSYTLATIGENYVYDDPVTIIFDDGRQVLASVDLNGQIGTVGSPVVPTNAKIGDLDPDGEITVADALTALRIAAKLTAETSEYIRLGDTDLDGHVTVADALAILRVAAKLIPYWEIDPYAL